MTKLKNTEYIPMEDREYDAYEADACEINHLIELLNKAKSLGATHIEFGGNVDWGSVSSVYLQPVKISEESDEDYAARQDEEKRRAEKQKKYNEDIERKQYLRLKEKYGKEI